MASYKGGKAAKALNEEQLFRLALGAGFPADKATVMAAVAKAESGGVPNIIGGPNSNGTYDYGLWQINSVHKPASDWDTPQRNALMAYKVFSGGGFRAWSTCKDAACSNLAGKGKLNPSGVPKHNPDGPFDPVWPDDITPSPPDIPGAIGQAAAKVFNGFGDMMEKLASNVLMIVLAVVFIVLGILLVRGKSIIKGAIAAKEVVL